jgi:hypothetical protein
MYRNDILNRFQSIFVLRRIWYYTLMDEIKKLTESFQDLEKRIKALEDRHLNEEPSIPRSRATKILDSNLMAQIATHALAIHVLSSHTDLVKKWKVEISIFLTNFAKNITTFRTASLSTPKISEFYFTSTQIMDAIDEFSADAADRVLKKYSRMDTSLEAKLDFATISSLGFSIEIKKSDSGHHQIVLLQNNKEIARSI